MLYFDRDTAFNSVVKSRSRCMLVSVPHVMTGRCLVLISMILLAVPTTVESATAFCHQVIEPHGYDCEEYTVQTDDGFVLALHRLRRMQWPPSTSGDYNDSRSAKNISGRSKPGYTISQQSLVTDTSNNSNSTSEQHSKSPARQSSPVKNETMNSDTARKNTSASGSNHTTNLKAGKGAPVLLMHQEFLNGDSWFQYTATARPSRLLPFMLIDDGFDVWIGHQRATFWGHGHVHLKFTDREYWDWTWDQHADYDLPAQLRLISAEANQPVHVIGASQAATVGAAGSTNHETARMMRSLTLIGPTAYRGNSNSLLLDAWAYYFGAMIDSEYYSTGFQNGAFNFSAEFPGVGNITGSGLSGLAIGLISGPNCCLGSTVIQAATNGWDGTTSFKNLLHWQQGIRTNRFARYDFGTAARNNATYGQPTSPTYNPAQIPRRLPVFVIAGTRDWTAPLSGTLTFLRLLQMPARLLNLTNYAHYDLTFSVNRENDVYLPILRFLRENFLS